MLAQAAAVGESVALGERVGEEVRLAVAVFDLVAVGVEVAVGDAVPVAVCERVRVGVTIAVDEAAALAVAVCDRVTVGVVVGDAVRLAVAVAAAGGDGVPVRVALRVGLGVGIGVAVRLRVTVGVAVGVGVLDWVTDAVVATPVAEGECVALGVSGDVEVLVGDGPLPTVRDGVVLGVGVRGVGDASVGATLGARDVVGLGLAAGAAVGVMLGA